MVEVSPEIPPSTLSLTPVPRSPSRNGPLVHKGHVKAVIKFGPPRLASEIPLTELVSCTVIHEVVSANGHCGLEHTASPSVIVPAIDHSKGSELYGDPVKRSLEALVGGDAEQRQLSIADLVALEGVAVIARKPARPVGVVARPDRRLESETLLYRP